MTFGLIGHPVSHTLSPLIHNMLANGLGDDLVYVPFDVKDKGELESAVKGAEALGIAGLNVTVPYKRDVMPFLSDVDERARAIGAVNTLVRMPDSKGFKGYNTDIDGLERALGAKGVSVRNESVMILGAGGVARPAAFMSAFGGASGIYILNRTKENAENLARDINAACGRDAAHAYSLSEYGKLPSDRKYLCIQCTSVGLGEDRAVIEDEAFYHRIHTAFDTVYRPLETRFLKLCRGACAATVTGLSMLLYQGVRAYELWMDRNDSIPDSLCDRIYEAMLKELEGESIVLTGFMGSGKSTVSGLVAEKLGVCVLDSDREIEKKNGMSVSEIFESMGEEAFRSMETEYLSELLRYGRGRIVLSAGGGMPVREENRKLLKRNGRVIYLKTSPEEVIRRLKGDTTRPLLMGDDPENRVRKLMEEREEAYMKASDIVIDTDDLSPYDVAEEVIRATGGI